MRDVRVGSWTELHESLFEASWDPELRRHRSRFAFRGMAREGDELCAGLSRFGPHAWDLEEPILRTFRKYARMLVHAPDDSVWGWLAVAQHHGLPTRLVDWTFSPYVALHFLTEDASAFDRDGVVWAIDYVAAKRLLPGPLAAILAADEANVFTTDMLDRAARSLHDLDALGHGFVVFLEPPSLDERIVNQYALFSLMPRGGTPGRWLADHADLARRIVVPAGLKWEIRDKLDQANVTERVLFPGLDGLSRWVRRYYTPRT